MFRVARILIICLMIPLGFIHAQAEPSRIVATTTQASDLIRVH